MDDAGDDDGNVEDSEDQNEVPDPHPAKGMERPPMEDVAETSDPDKEQTVVPGNACLDSAHITHLENNARFGRRRQVDIIATQEHKLSNKGIADLKQTFRLGGWDLLCGPAEQASTRTNAGVGPVAGNARIIKGECMAVHFEKAFLLGMG